jgi:hypothetical protein
MALDGAGNLYVTGELEGDSPQEGGQRDDIVTIKYDADGKEMWSKTFDSNSRLDWPRQLAVDAAGNVAIVGETGIGTGNNWDYLTLRYDTNGNFLWAHPHNGKGSRLDYLEDAALDSQNNMIVTSRVFDSAPGRKGGTRADYETLKYSPDGRLLWKVPYDYAHLDDLITAVVIDHRDHIIVTGQSENGDGTSSIPTIKYAP